MNTSIASNVLEAIDNIEVVTQESDLDVCLSIYGQLIKQSVILEEYRGDEIEGFSIFQEGEILDQVKEKGKNDSAIMRVIKFLPRLIMAFVDAIKNKITHAKNKYNLHRISQGKDVSKKAIESIKKEKKKSPVYKLIIGASIACGVTAGGTLILRIKDYGPAVEFKDDVNFQIADDLSEIRVQFPFYKIDGMKQFNSEFSKAFEPFKNEPRTGIEGMIKLLDYVVINQARISERDFTIESWDNYFKNDICNTIEEYGKNIGELGAFVQTWWNDDSVMSGIQVKGGKTYEFVKRVEILVKRSQSDLELVTKFNDKLHQVLEILANPENFSKREVKKANKVTYKPLKLDNYVDIYDIDTSNLSKAIDQFNEFIAKCPEKDKLNEYAKGNHNYSAALGYIETQFNCSLDVKMYEGGGATPTQYSIKGKEGAIKFNRYKGFDLGGAKLTIYNDTQFCYNTSPKVAGQMQVAIICHEIFHNIALLAGTYGGKVTAAFKRAFSIATDVYVKIFSVFLNSFAQYTSAIGVSRADHVAAFEKTESRLNYLAGIVDDPTKVQEFTEQVAKDEDNMTVDNSQISKDKNLLKDAVDVGSGLSTYKGAIQVALSTIVNRFNMMLGGGWAILGLFASTSDIQNLMLEKSNEETMCDMCAAMYKLPVHLTNEVQNWLKNHYMRNAVNSGKFDVHATTMSRETMSYNLAKQMLDSGKITDPNILKYLSHIVSSNKGVNKAENQLTKAQIKHLAPEFMEDFNKGLNKWLAKNNMPLKSVSTSDIF